MWRARFAGRPGHGAFFLLSSANSAPESTPLRRPGLAAFTPPVANADTGIIAVRRLGFGVFTLARAYAAEHGLTLEDAVAALQGRSRLPVALPPGAEVPPEQRTTTYVALAPQLKQLRDDALATID